MLEVTQRYPPAIGGVEDHVARLVHHLAAAGAEVEVVTTDLATDRPFRRLVGVAPEPRVHRHVAVPFLPLPHGLGIAAPGMVSDVLRTPADVVHAHAFGYAPTLSAALRRRLRPGPVVITPHSDAGRGGPLSGAYSRAVARATLRTADRVIALTHGERARLEGLGVDARRLRVIPNGVDLAEFSATPSDRSSPGFRILFVGRLYTVQKGLDTLTRALDLLGPQYELRLAGEDWGGREHVERWARRGSEPVRCSVLGAIARSDLLREYRQADVVVVPSRFEPFGIVLLEAMASGRPVVASRVGGIPEIVEDGVTGILVPPGDPAALATALGTMRSDPSLRRALGASGRRRVERYDWSRLAPEFVSLFEELTAR